MVKIIIKFLITFFLLFLVFNQLDYKEIENILKKANLFYLFLAFFFFNLSKIISAIRLNLYLKELNITLSFKDNLILYYLGMFYNMFLIGGIGGDGYKVYLLNKLYSVKVKSLLKAFLLDRISGLVALIFLASFIYIFLGFNEITIYLDLSILFLIFPLFYFIVKKFDLYKKIFFSTTVLGLLVQLMQIISAYFILLALGLNNNILLYLFLFLISSVMAVLPLTIGGVGIREFTFIYAANFLDINKNLGVIFSLLFFLITLFSSLIGVLFINYFHKK